MTSANHRHPSGFTPARENPFATRYTDNLPFHFSNKETWDTVFRRFELLGFRGAVTGPKGSGKTTFMLQFAEYLKGKAFRVRYLRLAEGRRFVSLRDFDHDEILLLDGYEQLHPASRLYLRLKTYRIRGFLLSCHSDPPCSVLLDCLTSPKLLHDLIKLLTEDDNFVSLDGSKALLEHHSNSIRDALRSLYDLTAARESAEGYQLFSAE